MKRADELPFGHKPADRLAEHEQEPEARLQRQVTLGVAAAVLITAFLGVFSWGMARLAARNADRVSQTYGAEQQLQQALRHADDVEAGVRGFALTGAEQFLEPYESGKKAAAKDKDRLRSLITDTPDQQQRLSTLFSLTQRRLVLAAAIVAERRETGKMPGVAELLQGKQVMDAMRATVRALDLEEQRLLRERVNRSYGWQRITSAAIGLGAFAGIVFLCAAGVVIQRRIGVAARAQAEIRALNVGLEQRVEERTSALTAEAVMRREIEKKLRSSDEMFRTLLDGIKDYAIYMLDTEGCVATWNSGAARITGYTSEEIIGQHVSRFTPLTSTSRQHVQDSLQKAILNGRSEEEALRVRKDGTLFWSHAVITSLYDAWGGLSGFSKVMRDVTARKQADEELRKQATLLNLAHDAIIVRDLQARIVFWNRGAEVMYGWSAEEAAGQLVHDLLQTAFPTPLAAIEEMLAIDGQWEGELRHKTRSGVEIVVTSRMSRQLDARGAPLATMEINRDITDRKQAEEIRERLAAVVNYSTDAIMSKALDGTVTDWNRGAETLFGYSAAEIVGKPILEVMPPEAAVEELAIIGRIARGEQVENFETVWQRKNGTPVDVSIAFSPIRDGRGIIVGASKVARDITKNKRDEAILREKEHLLSQSQRIAHIGSWTCELNDPERRLVWSDELYRLCGLSAETFAPTVERLIQRVHPEDQPAMRSWIAACEAGETPADLEFRMLLPNGTERIFSRRGELEYDAEHRPVRITGTTQDITERKRGEERLKAQAEQLARSRQELETQTVLLQSILDSLQEGLVVMDEHANFILWNPAAKRIIGVESVDLSPEEWSAHHTTFLPDMVTPFPNEQKPLLRAIAGEASSAVMYLRNPTQAKGIWIESNGAPLRDMHGKLRGGVLAFRDITQRKADELEILKLNEDLEERIARRTAELQTANNELQAFTYSVSHDLRAPLRHISGFARILIADYGEAMEPGAKAHLQRIVDAVTRMGLLVDGLLGLAKVGRQALKLQPNSLNAIVEQVSAMLQPEYEGRAVEWRIAELPVLECDRILIGQVFQNLLSNALKYSRKRTPAVIEVDSFQPAGQPTVVFVRDNGAGFEMRYASKLFEVFQRMHTEAEFEGTGVGLATVHRIIQKHGGRIWAEAEVDHGATFYFTVGSQEQAKPVMENVAAAVS